MVTAIILLSVFLSSMAHLMLKLGMNHLNQLAPVDTADWLAAAWTPAGAYVAAGVFFHFAALLTWLYALKHADVSYAYPFIALGFILVIIVAHFFMHEPVNLYRLIGVGLIVVGILFVSQS